jgi:hypothetical protein
MLDLVNIAPQPDRTIWGFWRRDPAVSILVAGDHIAQALRLERGIVVEEYVERRGSVVDRRASA